MQTRTKITAAILLGILYFCLQNYVAQLPCKTYEVTAAELQAAYTTYNITEFNGTLPADTLIDFEEHDKDNMATTNLLADGKFRISFNPRYTVGVRVMNMTMLHEMCHLKTWGDEHGPLWQSCMLDLDKSGAFREIIIDGYKEPKFLVNGRERQ